MTPDIDHSSFSANRKRLLEHAVAGEFFRGVVEQARALKLLSGKHFTVDGTLIEPRLKASSAKARNRAITRTMIQAIRA